MLNKLQTARLAMAWTWNDVHTFIQFYTKSLCWLRHCHCCKEKMNVGLGHNNVQRTVHWRGSARQLRLYLGPWPHRSLTLAPWSPHHIGTDWGHWPRLTTRPARGLGPASRTPGHVCRLIYVIFITSHCSMKIIKQMAKIRCNIAQIHHSLLISVSKGILILLFFQ